MKILIFSLVFLSALVVYCQAAFSCKNSRQCNNGTCIKKKCRCDSNFFGNRCEYSHECYRKCPKGKVCKVINNKGRCVPLPCVTNADIVMALDCSGSISKSEFKLMIATMEKFIDKLEVAPQKVHLGAFLFNDHISDKVIHLKDYLRADKFKKALEKLLKDSPELGTRTDIALKFMREDMFTAANGDRPNYPNIAIIMTDGKSNKPAKTLIQAAKLKNKKNVHIIVVGIGFDANDTAARNELNAIASTNDDVILTNFKELDKIVEPLLQKTCQNATDPCDPNPCKNNGTCEQYMDSYICNCPCSYVGYRCETRCNIRGDFVIVLDESGSITLEKFNKIIDVVVHFIKVVDIENGKVRIGIITYAFNVYVHFRLNSYFDKVDMLYVTELLRTTYMGGPTMTHKALRYLKNQAFKPENGGRSKYPHYVLFFTDGKSRFPGRTRSAAAALQRTGKYVYAIGVGDAIRKREIYYIASRPKKHHMIFTTFNKLMLAFKRLLIYICYDLKPFYHCMKCKRSSDCSAGMLCCYGCCQDMVTLAC